MILGELDIKLAISNYIAKIMQCFLKLFRRCVTLLGSSSSLNWLQKNIRKQKLRLEAIRERCHCSAVIGSCPPTGVEELSVIVPCRADGRTPKRAIPPITCSRRWPTAVPLPGSTQYLLYFCTASMPNEDASD